MTRNNITNVIFSNSQF